LILFNIKVIWRIFGEGGGREVGKWDCVGLRKKGRRGRWRMKCWMVGETWLRMLVKWGVKNN
jgi:hypothetical protein